MKRYLRTLLLTFVASLSAVSCVNEMELSEPITDPDVLATFVPRVHSFANEYVTRAEYLENETKITTLSLFVFDETGKLVSYIEDLGNVSSFQLKKSGLGNDADLDNSTVYLLANVNSKSLSELENLTDFENASIQIADNDLVITDLSAETFKGFPMMGKINANLSPSGWPQPVLEIPLKILYAKVKFEVSVAQGTENEGSGMQFVMTGYTVNNVAKQTPIKEPAADTDFSPVDHAYLGGDDSFAVQKDGNATMASGETSATKVEFAFYMAETRYSPKNPATGVYPDDAWLNDTDHDHLKQYFKPKLADTEEGSPYQNGKGLATYVTLQGTYTDYRRESWNVNYKIYLGKNNFNNFQVDRNSQYTNLICIMGIRNNSEGVGEVWIDHRVDAKTDDAADHVKITRETLIDSHIEVRPLRVQWKEGEYTTGRLYLPTNNDGSLVNWIGVECFTGDNCKDHTTYCVNKEGSTGKRRYFTTSLIGELQQSDQVETDDQGKKYIPLSNGHCAWIYFDENTTENNRPADIKVVFYNDNGPHEEIYAVNQRGLLKQGDLYYESYEEYLHTYDSADKYNLSTSPVDYTGKGLPWGFKGEDLSGEIIVAAMELPAIKLPLLGTYYIQDILSQRYDYFHVNDQDKKDNGSVNGHYMYTKQLDGSWEDVGNGVNKENPINGSGIIFTDRAAEREFVTVEDMGSMPQNAYQYCLSKNKFTANENDNISMIVHWYLPDAYEMDAILQESNAVDLNLNANYWTSQPSFSRQGVSQLLQSSALTSWMDLDIYKNLTVIDEVTDKARAVSKGNRITDIDRGTPNRIRCLYSAKGIQVNLNDRIPDGVNGNYTFVMKGDNANQYFNYLKATQEDVESNTNTTKGSTQYKHGTFNYPTVEESYGEDKPFSKKCFIDEDAGHQGFLVNPTDKQYWGGGSDRATDGRTYTYYTLLAEYPGLSNKELKNDYAVNINKNGYRELDSNKKDTKLDSTSTTFGFSIPITESIVLRSLDHTVGGDMFAVTIDNSSNNSNSPAYVYQQIVEKKKIVYTRQWDIVYKETSYVKTIKTEEMDFEGEGTSTVEKTGLNKNRVKESAQQAAEEGAMANALSDAVMEVRKNSNYATFVPENHPKSLITYTKIHSDMVGTQGGLLDGYKCKWTATYKCTIKMPKKESSETVSYFAEPKDPWHEIKEPVNIFNQVQLDELRIFTGNSFTVSLSEKYKKDYEIVKVKVHYSGDTYLDKKKVESGMIDDNYSYYARFVDASINLNSNPANVAGMSYTDNGNNTGTQQWSGTGRPAVTMVLANYIFRDYTTGNDDYVYGNADSSFYGKYLVVDRIEVKVQLKTTASTE